MQHLVLTCVPPRWCTSHHHMHNSMLAQGLLVLPLHCTLFIQADSSGKAALQASLVNDSDATANDLLSAPHVGHASSKGLLLRKAPLAKITWTWQIAGCAAGCWS